MKLQPSLLAGFLSTIVWDTTAFQVRISPFPERTGTVPMMATTEECVTKEDLLAARDDIDQLLREKACGTYHAIIIHSIGFSVVIILRVFCHEST